MMSENKIWNLIKEFQNSLNFIKNEIKQLKNKRISLKF